jgi:hypothetical protein
MVGVEAAVMIDAPQAAQKRLASSTDVEQDGQRITESPWTLTPSPSYASLAFSPPDRDCDDRLRAEQP